MARLTSAVPVLTATDVAADHAFWVERLGFTGGLDGDDFGRLSRDDVQLFVCSVDEQVVPDNTQVWVRVQGLDELHAEWSSRVSTDYADTSGPAITQISEFPWGREFAVRDPAGNCVHFSERG